MTNSFALPGPDSHWQIPGAEPTGFWAGFWHGLIFPLTFLISLFNPKIRIYETNNSGRWYDFGFVLGAGAEFIAGSTGAR